MTSELTLTLLHLLVRTVSVECSAAESTIFQATRHKGPVRGLDFNYGKKQLLASGSSEGEVRSNPLRILTLARPRMLTTGCSPLIVR